MLDKAFDYSCVFSWKVAESASVIALVYIYLYEENDNLPRIIRNSPLIYIANVDWNKTYN